MDGLNLNWFVIDKILDMFIAMFFILQYSLAKRYCYTRKGTTGIQNFRPVYSLNNLPYLNCPL